jgi:uncharacterized protein (TIGR03083 family)
MGPPDFLEAFRGEAAAVSAALHNHDLAVPVPACPGWDLAELGRHLGATHRWAMAAIVTCLPNGEAKGPDDPAEVADWYDESAELFADLLDHTPPDAPAWHFGPKPRHADFWFRRQALEAAVHRWDAETACEIDSVIDPVLSANGVAEIAEIFFPRSLRNDGGPGPDLAIALQTTDVASPDALLSTAGTDGPPTPLATIQGTAQSLLLLGWGRLRLDDPAFTVSGDHAVAERFAAAGLVP